jgi:chromosomal replication initiator protein
MKPQTLFDRVAFLEAKLTRLEKLVQHQDAVMRAAGLTVHDAAFSAVESPRQRKMREVCNDVCLTHDVTIEELRGDARARAVSWPRQDAMRLLAAAGYSLQEIGRYLGRRDHTTVLHGIRASEARMQE